jgi:hypothetical protein
MQLSLLSNPIFFLQKKQKNSRENKTKFNLFNQSNLIVFSINIYESSENIDIIKFYFYKY